ncbi:MAG: NERD domain-containing protein [Actinobacteria bacterium]|nr:NERD domain-containing protein [Actinomycetota bacterium]
MKNNKKSPLKDRPLHVAGQSVDVSIINLAFDGLTIFFILVILSLFLFFELLYLAFPSIIVKWLNQTFPPHVTPITIIISIISLIGIIYCIYRIIIIVKRIKSLKLGRDGERIVAEIFDDLRGQGFVIFHDIVAGNFNIDHVILTPHGIFTVETKTYSKPPKGEIICKDENIIAGNINLGNKIIVQAESESKWLKSILKESTGKNYHVMPVIVFPGWFVKPIPENLKKRIWILNPKALPSFINNEPVRIKESDMHLAAFHISRYIRMYN